VDPAASDLVGAQRALHERQEGRDDDQPVLGTEGGQHAQPLGRLVVLRQRALERQRGTLGKDPQVAPAHPGGEVVGQAVSFLVRAGHHDEWSRRRQGRAPSGNVRRPRGGGHANDARLRQMGPKGVDERSNAAITAA
jgi:hypothetical protein